jgi:D-alanyl-D-alanine carboxypeptidase/D-alanyl-D-alanine-endopeptidase (penicillin-binding protein 4)
MRRTICLILTLAGWTTAGAQTPVQNPAPEAGATDAASSSALARTVAPRERLSAAVADLRGDLEKLIRSANWRGDEWSVAVVSLDRGDTLFDHHADLLLAPASNMKLFTVSAALYYLGPDYRYNTFLLATGPVQDGSVLGDLVIYGTGDPTLSDRFSMKTSVWEAFADTLAASGVREVRGSIVGDASYFDGPGSGEGWQPEYINASYAAPASALSYAENIATLQIRPGTQVGWRPEVRPTRGRCRRCLSARPCARTR